MAARSHIDIIGNVGGDPELKFTGDGVAIATFSVAVNHRRKNGDDWVDDGQDWYRVTAWRGDAEGAVETIKKGMRVRVEGTLKTNTYETKDGSNRTSLELTADREGIAVVVKPPKAVGAVTTEADDTPW